MAYELIQILIKDYPQVLNERYGIEIGDSSVSAIEILEMIGKKRGCLKKGAEIDLLKTSKILIEDFRTQKLGKITLEMP
jgi:ribosome biogenesis GTPase A